jgi:hypothetical protein
MKTFIIITEADNNGIDRRDIERIEGTHYKIPYNNDGYDKITAHKVYKHLQENVFKSENFAVMELAEFTQEVNDQELDNLTSCFIGYVTAELIE